MARLLAAACLLHVLGGVVHGGTVHKSAAELWQKSAGYSGSCTGCSLYKMVTDCPLDVMFLLDMSESIPQISYENARNYVANQMQIVSDTFQDTHVGLLAFSEIVHHDIPLQQRNAVELQQLTNRVRSLPQERYGTELADTLRRARRALANSSTNTLVPGQKRGKVLVLVSDGCEDDDRSVEQEGVQAVLDGIYIISVALSHAYLDILKKISVQILEIRTNIDWKNTVACPSKFLPHVLPTEECSNVVVAMDGSDSVRRWEKVMRNYLAYTSMRYDNVDNAMGVVVFGTNVNTQSSATMLPPTKDKRWLAEQIETNLEFPSKRGTGTTAAIQVATEFLNRLGATTAPLNSIVVITDGPALNPAAARQALANAVSEGFKVVVIGVGNVTNRQELQNMAGPNSIVLQVASYLDLYSLDLAQYICRRRQGNDCSNLPACSVPGQTRRPINNCQCLCDDAIFCSGGQIINPATCQCGCPSTIRCPAGQNLNPTTCVCSRQGCQINPCRGNFRQNPDTCECEPICDLTCNYPYQLDSVNCRCETICTTRCNLPYRLDPSTCQCVCHQKCGSGQRVNTEACTCEPICDLTCNNPYRLDSANCRCDCNLQCSFPLQLNRDRCQCECAIQCGTNEDLDRTSCQCIPRVLPCTKSCPPNYVRTSSNQPCDCVCGLTSCPGQQTLNLNTCSCEGCTNTVQCSRGYRFDRSSCSCVCGLTSCPGQQTLNYNTCSCEGCTNTVQCSRGYRFDRSSCSCVCGLTSCPGQQTLNYNTCSCECAIQCGTNEDLVRTTCQCISRVLPCSKSCPPNYVRSSPNQPCDCVCGLTSCPGQQTLNYNTCSCEGCTNTVQCSRGYRFDRSSCSCVCGLTSCPGQQTLNYNTCSCECAIQCGTNEDLDRTTCQCIPRVLPCSKSCPPNYVRTSPNQPCDCVCGLTSCPGQQTLNYNTCSCEGCTNTVQCSRGYRFDRSSCSCVCGLTSCPGQQTLNYNTCSCECAIQCGTNEDLDRTTCQCIPRILPCTKSCPPNYVRTSPNQPCDCVCGLTSCPGQQTLNSNTCSCECAIQCGTNEDLDRTSCQCIPRVLPCSKSCPPNYVRSSPNQPCDCVCGLTSCPGQQTLNYNTCSCEGCTNTVQCSRGYRFDRSSCSCVCGLTSCPGQQTLNYNTCSCEGCTNTVQCSRGYRFDRSSCSCVPICSNTQNCPANTVFNPVNCTCEPRGCPNTLNCPANSWFNADTCTCEPNCITARPCPAGSEFNFDTCTCVRRVCQPKACGAGYEFDLNLCQCVRCRQKTQCQQGYYFDENRCQCVQRCNKVCSAGTQLDPVSCQCGPPPCTRTCSAGQILDRQTCTCVRKVCQPKACGAGYEFDLNLCQCVRCRQKTPCQQGTYFDENRCQCEPRCPNTLNCPANSWFNADTCKCEPNCITARPCPAGSEFNFDTCACVRRVCQPKACGAGYEFDLNQCQCVRCRQKTPCQQGTYFDENRCQCVQRCNKVCSAGTQLDPVSCQCGPPPCTRTCSAGQILDRQTCTCVPDAGVVERCSAQEYRCDDNQLAFRDCYGRCQCRCSKTRVGKHCEIPVEPTLCDNCTLNNGHYLAPVKGRCDLYVVCKPLGNERYLPIVSQCSPGTIFNHQGIVQQCVGPEQGATCFNDPCSIRRGIERYAHSMHCAKYWECQNGVTVRERCCPQGQSFDSLSSNCRPDSNCPNDCAPGFKTCNQRAIGQPTGCPYRANPNNRKQFFHHSAPTIFQTCANTDFFNETACLCTRDKGCVPDFDFPFDTSTPNNSVALRANVPGANGRVGYFNGNSRIILHRFGGSGFYFDYLDIGLRVKRADNVNTGYGRQMAIVSNGDCNRKESVAITFDERNVYFKVTPDGATQPEILTVPYSPSANGWLDIQFIYEKQGDGDVYQMTGRVNGQSQNELVSGRIADRVCALQIGHGLGYDSLRGYVDDLKIWTCRHSGSVRRGNNNNGYYNNYGSNTYNRNQHVSGSKTYTG